jgi:hypothetical protein
MQGNPVPASLANVIGPLREADEYARLQGQRQRGVYNILTGLPGFFFVGVASAGLYVGLALGFESDQPALRVTIVLGWIFFFLSCFTPQILLPAVRRRRPDWTSPLLESSLLKQALEKLFWWQFPFWLVGQWFPVFIVLPMLFLGDFRDMMDLGVALAVALHVVGTAVLAWRSARSHDRLLASAFLAVLPLGFVPLFLKASQFPNPVSLAFLAVGLVLPPLVVGLVRLLAPRRWLVR